MNDVINGIFEFGGSIFLFLNVLRIHRDKCYRGVSALPFVFYTAWGFWNCWFYPSVDCWASFAGGVAVVSVNSIYCCQLWWYRGR